MKFSTRAVDVLIGIDSFSVVLEDGREMSVPYAYFPRLATATDSQRRKWRFIGKGSGLHWDEVDEDISVASILGVSED
jgi:hypothetical protein